MDFQEFFLGAFTIAAIFLAIPVVIFFIVSKILSNRHKERMAMIEKGINPNANETYQQGYQTPDDMPDLTPKPAAKPVPRPDSKTSKWMYILAGLGVGLILSSIVENILFNFTMINTKGFGFAIILLCISIALYLFYNQKRPHHDSYHQKDNDSYTE